jgi:hypothetical protein
LEDRSRYGRQLVVGVLGWLVAGAMAVWLATHASQTGVRITLFLAAVAIIVAVLAVSVAVDVLRPPLVKGRGEDPAAGLLAATDDALGRPLETDGAQDLRGEFTIGEEAGVRRYRER